MEFIDLKKQQDLIKEKLDISLKKVLEEGSYILGPEVEEIEQKLAEFSGSEFCLTTASGTDSLLMALLAIDIKPGDEIITTPFTWISTVEVIKLVGAVPIYCDIDIDTFNMDPSKLEALITPNTRAIIPVSLFGQCVDFDLVNDIASSYDIPVIEDGAQSFGAEYNGKRSCALTSLGCTSFFPSKPLGCYGDGGAIFTNDEILFKKLKAIRAHGASSKNNFDLVGLNGRFDTIQAAILLNKLEIFDHEIKLRQEKALTYKNLFSEFENEDLGSITFKTPVIEEYNLSVFAQYTLITDDRNEALKRMTSSNIPYAIHYEKLAFEHKAYKPQYVPDVPNAHHLKERVFSIPMHPYLEYSEQYKVVECLYNRKIND